MALSSRDIWMVVRARDEASRTLRRIGAGMTTLDQQAMVAARKQINAGQALTTLGIGLVAVGAAGAAAIYSMVAAAIEYNRQSALTLTQVDQIGVSLDTIKGIGRRVAAEIPVPFETVQSSLYDIFSSMDVTAAEAEKILASFAKSAVAGQVDIQTAGRATIAIMNAFGMSTSDLGHIQDVMFQLVRKGVGTYDEFASTIGKAIPAAARTGQSIETLAGMLAFLTRNGLSASMASTSAARALEAIANPKTIARLQAIGVTVKDAKGEFLPLPDILAQMQDKMSKMTGPEKSSFMYELLKGAGGSIQARRFFDTVFKNFDEFQQRVGEMKDSTGALDAAFKTMSDTPAMKIQKFKNQLAILKTEMGDALLPILGAVASALAKVFHWFNNLSPGTKKVVAIILLVVTVFAILSGIVLVVVGSMLMLSGVFAMLGTSLGVVMGIAGLVVAAIVAIGVALFFIIKYHDQIWKFIKDIWTKVKDWIVKTWDDIYAKVSGVVKAVADWIVSAWNGLYAWVSNLWTKIKNFIVGVWQDIWGAVGPLVKGLADFIVNIWNGLYGLFQPILSALWNLVYTVFKGIWDAAVKWFPPLWSFISSVLSGIWSIFVTVFGQLWSIVSGAFQLISNIIITAWTFLYNFLKPIIGGFVDLFSGSFSFIVDIITVAMKIIGPIIEWTLKQIGGAFKWAIDFITNLVKAGFWLLQNIIIPVMTFILNGIKVAWGLIVASVKGAIEFIGGLIRGAIKFIEWFVSPFRSMASGVGTWLGKIVAWVVELPGKILRGLGNLGSLLFEAGKKIIQGLWDGMKKIWDKVTGWIGGIGSWIADHKGPLDRDYRLLQPAGMAIVGGLIKGMQSQMPSLLKQVDAITSSMQIGSQATFSYGATGYMRPVVPMAAQQAVPSGNNVSVDLTVNTQEIDPVKNSADLAWEITRRLGR